VTTGELYKQISNMIGFLEREKSMVLISHRVNLIEVLDEAKKDFPVYNEKLEEMLEKYHKVNQGDAVANYIQCVYGWFEKWFGSTGDAEK
jgi:hypothetical protein